MLILTRKCRETVVMGGGGGVTELLRVTVLRIDRGRVVLGIKAHADIPVLREEVWERKLTEDKHAVSMVDVPLLGANAAESVLTFENR